MPPPPFRPAVIRDLVVGTAVLYRLPGIVNDLVEGVIADVADNGYVVRLVGDVVRDVHDLYVRCREGVKS